MKNIKNYYLYIFISTLTRNIIDVYSIVYLYQNEFILKEIIYMYIIIYFLGIFFSKLVIKIGNKIGYKYLLMVSSIFTSISFYIIRYNHNIHLIALCLAISIFTYHPIRHYYGLIFLKQKREMGNTLIFTYIAILLSSYLVIKNIDFFLLLLISICSIIPAFFIKKNECVIISISKINNDKLRFFIFDQFKILFLMFESLYLYLISYNLLYVGIFNIILTLVSIIWIYVITSKIDIFKIYKYINIIFGIILILKINIDNKYLLLIIALLEGMGIKTNELVSNINLYNGYDQIEGYLILSEKVFCLVRVIILSVLYLLPIDIKSMLYILIVGIFILSFQYKKDTT